MMPACSFLYFHIALGCVIAESYRVNFDFDVQKAELCALCVAAVVSDRRRSTRFFSLGRNLFDWRINLLFLETQRSWVPSVF